MNRNGFALMAVIVLAIIVIGLVVFGFSKYRDYRYQAYLQREDQGCGAPPTDFTLDGLRNSTAKEILYETDWDTSHYPHFPTKLECVSLLDLAKRFSMPLYFPSYSPKDTRPGQYLKAEKIGNQETLSYSFLKSDGKAGVELIESNENDLYLNCAESSGKESDLLGGKLCELDKAFTVWWEIPDKVQMRISGDELTKVASSLILISR